jgi:hypothetical protein
MFIPASPMFYGTALNNFLLFGKLCEKCGWAKPILTVYRQMEAALLNRAS